MARQKRSLRNFINYILVVMCLLALMLVWFTVDQYQAIVVSEQRNSTANLAAHVVSEQLKLHESYLVDLGMSMQTDRKFRAVFANKDQEALYTLVADQFHQYFTTTELVDLKRITIYDVDFNVVTRASDDEWIAENSTICQPLLARAKARRSAERNKPLIGMCQQQGHPYQMAIVPIGGLRIVGYAAIAANPEHTLEQIKNLPSMPYSVSLPSGKILFKTADWPANINTGDTLIAQHTIKSDRDEPLLVLSVASDISKINQRLSNLMLYILILALSVTALFIFLTRTIFNKRIVFPLMQLKEHMVRVQHNQNELGKNIEFSACRELDELSKEFNHMAKKLFGAQRELHDKAHTDALTGLPNREVLYNRMDQNGAISRRENKRFSLLMIDLNEFKNVNDTMGHHAGDELIRQVGTRISECLRESDTIARLGGDEFAVLLPTTENRGDAIDAAKKIIQQCTTPYIIDGKEVTVGMSVGIAIYPDTADDSDFLMRCADKSMYQAKQSQSGYSMCEPFCGKHEACHQGFSSIPLPVTCKEQRTGSE